MSTWRHTCRVPLAASVASALLGPRRLRAEARQLLEADRRLRNHAGVMLPARQLVERPGAGAAGEREVQVQHPGDLSTRARGLVAHSLQDDQIAAWAQRSRYAPH